MKKLLYTGAFRFPDGDAAAVRVLGIGELFQAAGCDVAFAGWEQPSARDFHYIYQGHHCYPQGEFRSVKKNFLSRSLGFAFRGHRTLRWLWRNRDYDYVVAYNPPALFAMALLLMGKLFKFKTILDSTEWYQSEHLPGGRFGPVAAENFLRMRLVYLMFSHVICISSYLETYFRQTNTIRIPPLVSFLPNTTSRPSVDSVIHLLYAGEAGKKDKLLECIAALPTIATVTGRPVKLRVAGLEWASLSQLIEADGLNPNDYLPFVKCFGRISREEVGALYQKSHYSILFRDHKRYALAGFPTKAVESWSYGCPVITNAIGDLMTFASDGKNAIVMHESEIATELPSKLKILASETAYSRMSQHCIVDVYASFAADLYTSSISNFLGVIDTQV
jgi:glycosyltransferase involved in cell wall biosynthesis